MHNGKHRGCFGEIGQRIEEGNCRHDVSGERKHTHERDKGTTSWGQEKRNCQMEEKCQNCLGSFIFYPYYIFILYHSCILLLILGLCI